MKFSNIVGPQVRRHRYLRKWSQNKLAIKLQCAGLDVSRSDVAKIEARIKLIRDFELGYLAEALGVSQGDLFPTRSSNESTHDYVERLMNRRY